jgi:hypothetical protein
VIAETLRVSLLPLCGGTLISLGGIPFGNSPFPNNDRPSFGWDCLDGYNIEENLLCG